jgi:tRNA (guanine-N7-)-methyltransferase
MAAENPQCNFLGIEVYRPGIGNLLLKLKRLGISNVRIIMEDAVSTLHTRLGVECLSKLLIFFPDPWPKKRHHKRRLLQAGFLDSAVRCLRPGGYIHIATDWEDYAMHISDLLQNEQRLRNTAMEGRFVDRPADRPQTKYERRGVARGHKVWDMEYERTHTSGES